MLTHHSNLDYAVAASEAAASARTKMDEQINRGQQQAAGVIEHVQTCVPEDAIVVGRKVKFQSSEKGVELLLPREPKISIDPVQTLHMNARNQAAGRVGLPTAYVNDLLSRNEQWARELVAENFNKLFENEVGNDRFLLRSVKGEVRGFLSDRYRRLDARPILDAFLGGIMRYGAVPVDGKVTETKVSLKAVLPFIFEPIPNEVMLIGAEYENSDFGNGAVVVNTFVDRLWCTNFARSESLLRKVHLGARLDENVLFSRKTYELDTKAMASAIGDMAEQALSPQSINDYLALVKAANEAKVEGRQVTEWMKSKLTKSELQQATEAFNSPEIEMLPAGMTKWRMSNAISFIAQKAEPERALQLQRVAGEALGKAA